MKKSIAHVLAIALSSALFLVFVATSSAAWKPIIGIPKPPFGIDEIAPAVPSPWNSNVSGYYYVQSGGANSGNGYPGNPRSQIPNPVPAGSVVVISGTYTTKHEGSNAVTINGTSAKPVFIKGGSPSSHGVFSQKVEFIGSYYIIEYMDAAWSNSSGNGKLNFGGDHGVVRHGDFRGDTNDGVGGVNAFGSYMVVYDCYIHHSGNVNATYDQDNHGTTAAGDHLWIVYNHYHANSGDGIQLNGDSNSSIQYAYIGGNISHGNKQTGMWTKKATDVIFSQNTVYGHRMSNSSMGDGMGMQYAPEYVWFIFNTIYDNECGIRLASDSGGAGTHHYIIGNLIYNIHKKSSPYDINNSWETAAIAVWGSTYTEVVNNTIWDVDAGINSPRDRGALNIVNNILGSPTIPGANTIWYYVSALKNSSTGSNNLFGLNSRIKIGTSSTYSYNQIGWPNCLESGAPGFIDQAGGNYNLTVESLAKDKATLYQAYSTFQQRYGIDIAQDIAQRPRPQGAGWDIGAYEYSESMGINTQPEAPQNFRALNQNN